MGAEALAYNPPFAYCMGAYTNKKGSRQLVAGLGNGMLLRFKKKGFSLEEVSGDAGHGAQVAALAMGEGLLVTASHDMTMGFHRMGDE